MKGRWLVLWCGWLLAIAAGTGILAGEVYQLASPDGRIQLTVQDRPVVSWSVAVNGRPVLAPSRLCMEFDTGLMAGRQDLAAAASRRQADEIIKAPVPWKRAVVPDRYNELKLDYPDGYSIIFRACDDGAAYRFATRLPGEVKVLAEEVRFTFPEDCPVYFPEEESFLSHQERLYRYLRLNEITGARFCSLPALVELPAGPRVAITEADLLDYPGLDLSACTERWTLQGLFPAYPARTELRKDRNEAVLERENFLARTAGTRSFPWRVLAISQDDAGLLANDIVYRLASPCQLAETGWIRPGKVAWDWWNANNIYGVDFEAGINTATYKYYIDFAARYGIEYVILDEGWYPLGNLLAQSPGIDVPALCAYGREKGVGIILWVVWKTLDQQMEEALDLFARWGVKGIKVDFMQREDQPVVRFYEKTAREAARRRLLVDFHGAYKPTGMLRTFPNVLTSEGVRGLEHNKWGEDASPEHAVTFPFIRMLAGPADYTPGAMQNAAQKQFHPVWDRPMSQGTRCQQLAMYVVYDSPLQMLADSPSNYLREPECMEFLAKVPVVWEETRPLAAKTGDFILLARRHGREWYAGAMTDWTARDLEVDCSFLGAGSFQAEIYQDGANAHRCGIDYRRSVREVTAASKLRLHLAPGGGFAIRFTPRN